MEDIFDRNWVAKRIPENPARVSPFVHRLARGTDPEYTALRQQLEACWAQVRNQPRVLLGLLRSEQDLQNERARAVLYTGTTLAHLGWDVEWEFKDVDDSTPDFRLTKDRLDVLAEAVSPSVDDGSPSPKDTQLLQTAIDNLNADYGIWVSVLKFGRQRNLDLVRQHFETEMDTARAAGIETVVGEYIAPGVTIQYRLDRLPQPIACPYMGTTGTLFWGAVGSDELRAAVAKKIDKYRRPLIVITGVPTGLTPDFVALDDAMYGSESLTLDRDSGTLLGVTRGGGLMDHRGEEGDLIRKYLVGVLGVRLELPPSARFQRLLHQALGAPPSDPSGPEGQYRLRFHFFHARPDQDVLAEALLPLPQSILRRAAGGFEIPTVGDAEWSFVPGLGSAGPCATGQL